MKLVSAKELPDFVTPKERAERPAQAIDLKIVADYLQKQYNAVQAADPEKTMGEAAFSMTVKRLEKANERIPGEHPQLKALIVHAAQSPDMAALKERMETMKTDFIQHYSTAVQMTVDTSGKAEPSAPAASVRQTDPAPAPKPPAPGENVAAIEAKVKAGEVINLSDLSAAIKKDKQAAQIPQNVRAATGKAELPANKGTRGKPTAKTDQPSIKQQIAAGKQQISGQKSLPAKAAIRNKAAGLGD